MFCHWYQVFDAGYDNDEVDVMGGDDDDKDDDSIGGDNDMDNDADTSSIGKKNNGDCEDKLWRRWSWQFMNWKQSHKIEYLLIVKLTLTRKEVLK